MVPSNLTHPVILGFREARRAGGPRRRPGAGTDRRPDPAARPRARSAVSRPSSAGEELQPPERDAAAGDVREAGRKCVFPGLGGRPGPVPAVPASASAARGRGQEEGEDGGGPGSGGAGH